MTEEKENKKFEIICGIILTFFAAILSLADLRAGKCGDDEILFNNEKASAYQWYNSKSIKQNLIEGQRDLLISLLKAEVIQKDKIKSIQNFIVEMDSSIEKYSKEKKEILLGSEKVGKENWVQDIDGEFGKIIGAKEWEEKVNFLGKIGDILDMAILFLQLCLVMGAISLVVLNNKMKNLFFIFMIVLGIIGTFYTTWGYLLSFKIY